MCKWFISHSNKDASIAKLFIDKILESGLGFDINDIFCTSIDGTKISPGENWREEIFSNISSSLYCFLIITNNYKESEMCLCEMGAIWFSKKPYIALILDPITPELSGYVINTNQIEKMNDKYSINRIKDKMSSFDLKFIPSDRWASKVDEYISELNKYLNDNPFNFLLSRNNVEDLISERDKLNEENLSLKNNIIKCQKIITKLNNTKDKECVHEIILDSHKDEIENFKNIRNEIINRLNLLNKFSISEHIFKDYNDLDMAYSYCPANARARKLIFCDDDGVKINRNATELNELHEYLNNLNKILRTPSEYLIEYIKNEYKIKEDDIELSNSCFWEQCLDTKIDFDRYLY